MTPKDFVYFVSESPDQIYLLSYCLLLYTCKTTHNKTIFLYLTVVKCLCFSDGLMPWKKPQFYSICSVHLKPFSHWLLELCETQQNYLLRLNTDHQRACITSGFQWDSKTNPPNDLLKEDATLWPKEKGKETKANQEDFSICGDKLDKYPQTWTFTKAFPFQEQLNFKKINITRKIFIAAISN